MANKYIIKREEEPKTVKELNVSKNGYKMKPKLKKRKSLIDVKEIIIINPSLQSKVCRIQFNIIFRRLTMIIKNFIEENDGDDGDAIIAMNELERLKLLLLDHYLHYLSKAEVKKMLKKISVLENQLKSYVINYQVHQQQLLYEEQMLNMEEEKKGRGR